MRLHGLKVVINLRPPTGFSNESANATIYKTFYEQWNGKQGRIIDRHFTRMYENDGSSTYNVMFLVRIGQEMRLFTEEQLTIDQDSIDRWEENYGEEINNGGS